MANKDEDFFICKGVDEIYSAYVFKDLIVLYLIFACTYAARIFVLQISRYKTRFFRSTRKSVPAFVQFVSCRAAVQADML